MSKADDVITWAQTELGKPYIFADEGPNSFDCSGLMQFIFAKVGITLPRTAAQQQAALPRVETPRPGDLVFWGEPAHHVALYIGNGKIIQAPHKGAVVSVADVWGTPAGYGRVSGVGSAAAVGVGALTGAASTVSGWVSGLLGSARNAVLEWTVAGLGVALLGYGVYRIVKPQLAEGWRQTTKEVMPL